jgi:uncharacterized protein
MPRFLTFALGLLLASPALAAGPSFDCSKAKAPDEIAICGDAQLSELDRLWASAYDAARRASGRSSALSVARNGLAARSNCDGERRCIMSVEVAVILKFQDLGAKVTVPDWAMSATMDGMDTASGEAGALPTEIGRCANTAVAGIHSRFQENINASPDDGSVVEFENGGVQVSYEKEPGLLHAKVGDPVLMCLVEIPQDCPPGDDRGRVYTTTNLRTHESWTLPDSQHSCGGA